MFQIKDKEKLHIDIYIRVRVDDLLLIVWMFVVGPPFRSNRLTHFSVGKNHSWVREPSSAQVGMATFTGDGAVEEYIACILIGAFPCMCCYHGFLVAMNYMYFRILTIKTFFLEKKKIKHLKWESKMEETYNKFIWIWKNACLKMKDDTK